MVTHPTIHAIVQHVYPPGVASRSSGPFWEYHTDALALQQAVAQALQLTF